MKAIRHYDFGGRTPKKEDQKEVSEFVAPMTVVVDHCPTNEELIGLIQRQLLTSNSIHFPLHVGIARLHHTDRYNKKIGVKVASEKSIPVHYYSVNFDFHSFSTKTKLEITFRSVSHDNSVSEITFLVNTNGKYPEILSAAYKKPRLDDIKRVSL